MPRPLLLAALLILAACSGAPGEDPAAPPDAGSPDAGPIPDAVLQGTVDGRPFSAASARTIRGAVGANATIHVSETQRGCDDVAPMAEGERRVELHVPLDQVAEHDIGLSAGQRQ
ncbi:MAG: hypothetical protein ACK4N5_02125, partial [Myxococcales bacterium]